jgi:hypothetical protein
LPYATRSLRYVDVITDVPGEKPEVTDAGDAGVHVVLVVAGVPAFMTIRVVGVAGLR